MCGVCVCGVCVCVSAARTRAGLEGLGLLSADNGAVSAAHPSHQRRTQGFGLKCYLTPDE